MISGVIKRIRNEVTVDWQAYAGKMQRDRVINAWAEKYPYLTYQIVPNTQYVQRFKQRPPVLRVKTV